MKIPSVILAPLTALLFAGAIMIADKWELPSTEKTFATPTGETIKVEMIIEGVRCRGTANFLNEMLGKLDGIVSVTTFVQEHRVLIKYDPELITEEEIITTIDNPVNMPDGSEVSAFHVLEVNRDVK